MSVNTTQLPFSAKLPSHSAPPAKRSSAREREYLRPKEVEAMINAARSFGRHGVRDAAIILLMFRHGQRRSRVSCTQVGASRLSGWLY